MQTPAAHRPWDGSNGLVLVIIPSNSIRHLWHSHHNLIPKQILCHPQRSKEWLMKKQSILLLQSFSFACSFPCWNNSTTPLEACCTFPPYHTVLAQSCMCLEVMHLIGGQIVNGWTGSFSLSYPFSWFFEENILVMYIHRK